MQKQQIASQGSAEDKYSLCSKSGRKLYRRIHNNNVRILNKSKLSNRSNNSIGSVALRRTQLSNDKIYSREEQFLPLNISSVGLNFSNRYQIADSRPFLQMTPKQGIQKSQQRIIQTNSQKSFRSYSKRSDRGQGKKYKKLGRNDIEKLLMLQINKSSNLKPQRMLLQNIPNKNSSRSSHNSSKYSEKSCFLNQSKVTHDHREQFTNSISQEVSQNTHSNIRSFKPIETARTRGKIKIDKNGEKKEPPISQNKREQKKIYNSERLLATGQHSVSRKQTEKKHNCKRQIEQFSKIMKKNKKSKLNSYKSENDLLKAKLQHNQKNYNEEYEFGGRKRNQKQGKLDEKRKTTKALGRHEQKNIKNLETKPAGKSQNQYKIYQRLSSNNLTNRERIKDTRKKYSDQYFEDASIRNSQTKPPNSPVVRSSVLKLDSRMGGGVNSKKTKINKQRQSLLPSQPNKHQLGSHHPSQNSIEASSNFGSFKDQSWFEKGRCSRRYVNPDHQYYNQILTQQKIKPKIQSKNSEDSKNSSTSLEYHFRDKKTFQDKKRDKKTDISETFDSLMLSINSRFKGTQTSENGDSYQSIRKKLQIHIKTLKLIADYSHEFKKMYQDVQPWQELVFLAFKKFWVERVKVEKYLEKFIAIKANLKKSNTNTQSASTVANPFILPFCRISSNQVKALMTSEKGVIEFSNIRKQNEKIYRSLQELYNFVIEKSGDRVNMLYCDDFSDDIYVMMLEEIEQLIPNLEESKVFDVTKIRLSKIVKVGILLLFLNGKNIRNISEIVTYSDLDRQGQKKTVKSLTTYDLYYQTFEKLVAE